MAENFSVAISFKGSLGYVEYDESARKVVVNLGDSEGKVLAEKFLTTPHEYKFRTKLCWTSRRRRLTRI